MDKKHFLIYLWLFFCCPVLLPAEQFAVQAFKNISNFKNRKDFGQETARLFIRTLNEQTGIKADYMQNSLDPGNASVYQVKGIIKKCNLSSYGLIVPGRAGIVHYSSEVIIDLSILSNNTEIKNIEMTTNLTFNDLGLTILGGPGTSEEVETLVYKELQKYKITDREFRESIVGKALYACVHGLAGKFKQEFNIEKRTEQTISPAYTVIDKDKDMVYINAGSRDFVKTGDVFNVYRKGKPLYDPQTRKIIGYREEQIGRIQIIFVLELSLSKAKILEGHKKIKPGDIIRE